MRRNSENANPTASVTEHASGFFKAAHVIAERTHGDKTRRAETVPANSTEQARQAAVLAERGRLARELHDTLAQGLAGILVQLEAAEDVLPSDANEARDHLKRASDLARLSLTDSRRAIRALRPQELEEGDLAAALAECAANLTASGKIHVHFTLHGPVRPLPREVEDHLLRMSQEALANVLKHAQARTAIIELSLEPTHARLVVQDDGCGFRCTPPGHSTERNGGALISGENSGASDLCSGLGLRIMQERAAALGGEFAVTSGPGCGTRIEVRVPIRARSGRASSDAVNQVHTPRAHTPRREHSER